MLTFCTRRSAQRNSGFCNLREKVAEGLVAGMGRELTEQSQKSSAGKLVDRDYFAQRIPTMGAKEKCHHTCNVCADCQHRGKPQQKYTTTYCRKCNIHLSSGDCFKIYHTEVNCGDQYFIASFATMITYV